LTKKLRAIEELKLRQAGGEKLEKTQEQKIEKEDEIVDELQKLGFTG
jgi:translation initiation factor 2A